MKPDHRYAIRLAHWLGATVVGVLILSGIEIFRAFPSFGSKLPQSFEVPTPLILGLGGWLGGALSWHLLFGWLFAVSALLAGIDLIRGGWRRIWITRAELDGIWPMIRYYLRLGPKPEAVTLYNPLQKLAYLSVYGFGLSALSTGLLLAQPVQFGSWLLAFPWAWQATRVLHFASMLGLLGFVPGHLLMVVLAGKKPFLSMLFGEPIGQTNEQLP